MTHMAMDMIRETMPVAARGYDTSGRRTGLVIVDEIEGFATVGGGALAPQSHNPQVERMVEETDRLARRFAADQRPILVLLDTHEPGVPEPPYPPHCEAGSGEEQLVPSLRWLESCPSATLLRKDCINGFIGAHEHETGRNGIIDWIAEHRLDGLIIVGICTDICVMDFVLTMLSVRNHGMTPGLDDIVVYEPGCATYDLPRDDAIAAGLPESCAHPQGLSHHLGLYFMASRGAVIAARLD